jgi:hypothetical protein
MRHLLGEQLGSPATVTVGPVATPLPHEAQSPAGA